MSKPEIFTTSYTMDKETLVRYGEELSRHIVDQLGQRIAEKIYQECQKGERIVSVGEPYSQDILEMNAVNTSMEVRIQELVRCKDCRFHEQEQPGMVYCPATVGGWVEENWFCKGGERREE